MDWKSPDGFLFGNRVPKRRGRKGFQVRSPRYTPPPCDLVGEEERICQACGVLYFHSVFCPLNEAAAKERAEYEKNGSVEDKNLVNSNIFEDCHPKNKFPDTNGCSVADGNVEQTMSPSYNKKVENNLGDVTASLKEMKGTIEALKKQVVSLESSKANIPLMHKRIADLTAQLNSEKQKSSNADKECSSISLVKSGLEEQIALLEKQVKAEESRNANLQEQLSSMRESSNSCQRQTEELHSQMCDLKRELQHARSIGEQQALEMSALTSEFSRKEMGLQIRIESFSSHVQSLETSLATIKQELLTSNSEKEHLREEFESYRLRAQSTLARQKGDSVSQGEKVAREQYDKLKKELDGAREKMENNQTEIETMNNKLSSIQLEKARSDKRYEDMTKALHQKITNYDTLNTEYRAFKCSAETLLQNTKIEFEERERSLKEEIGTLTGLVNTLNEKVSLDMNEITQEQDTKNSSSGSNLFETLQQHENFPSLLEREDGEGSDSVPPPMVNSEAPGNSVENYYLDGDNDPGIRLQRTVATELNEVPEHQTVLVPVVSLPEGNEEEESVSVVSRIGKLEMTSDENWLVAAGPSLAEIGHETPFQSDAVRETIRAKDEKGAEKHVRRMKSARKRASRVGMSHLRLINNNCTHQIDKPCTVGQKDSDVEIKSCATRKVCRRLRVVEPGRERRGWSRFEINSGKLKLLNQCLMRTCLQRTPGGSRSSGRRKTGQCKKGTSPRDPDKTKRERCGKSWRPRLEANRQRWTSYSEYGTVNMKTDVSERCCPYMTFDGRKARTDAGKRGKNNEGIVADPESFGSGNPAR